MAGMAQVFFEIFQKNRKISKKDILKAQVSSLTSVTMRQLAASRRRRKSPTKNSRSRSKDPKSRTDPETLPEVKVRFLYAYFLSARHLHISAAVLLLLASAVGLFTLSITLGTTYISTVILPQLAIVFLEIAWFCCFRPAAFVTIKSHKNRYLAALGIFPSFPADSPKKNKIFKENGGISIIFSDVYVAPTGYYDTNGLPVYGLYAGAKILKG